jgi:hypothetical protein
LPSMARNGSPPPAPSSRQPELVRTRLEKKDINGGITYIPPLERGREIYRKGERNKRNKKDTAGHGMLKVEMKTVEPRTKD